MNVAAPPEPPRSDDLEALIREARVRARRRRAIGAAVVVAAAGAGIGIHALLAGDATSLRHGTGPRPSSLAAMPRCRAGQLQLSGRFNGAGAGSAWFLFAFTNESAVSCTLRGWPTLELRFADGRRFVVAAHDRELAHSGRVLPVRRVVLRPHRAASFNVLVRSTHAGGRLCPTTTAVSATPPGDRGSLVAHLARNGLPRAEMWACAGAVGVAQVVPGGTNPYMVG